MELWFGFLEIWQTLNANDAAAAMDVSRLAFTLPDIHILTTTPSHSQHPSLLLSIIKTSHQNAKHSSTPLRSILLLTLSAQLSWVVVTRNLSGLPFVLTFTDFPALTQQLYKDILVEIMPGGNAAKLMSLIQRRDALIVVKEEHERAAAKEAAAEKAAEEDMLRGKAP